MLTTILIAVAVLVIGVLLVAATRPAKVMGLFMSMDKAIGGQFEQGLAKLDAVSRAGASVAQV